MSVFLYLFNSLFLYVCRSFVMYFSLDVIVPSVRSCVRPLFRSVFFSLCMLCLREFGFDLVSSFSMSFFLHVVRSCVRSFFLALVRLLFIIPLFLVLFVRSFFRSSYLSLCI